MSHHSNVVNAQILKIAKEWRMQPLLAIPEQHITYIIIEALQYIRSENEIFVFFARWKYKFMLSVIYVCNQ